MSTRASLKMEIAVGKTFDSFSDLEGALEGLRKDGCHPLRVYNRLLKTITENNSVGRIPWNPSTSESFGTRTTVLDVSTMAKQGIGARDRDQINVVSQWAAKLKLPYLMTGWFCFQYVCNLCYSIQ